MGSIFHIVQLNDVFMLTFGFFVIHHCEQEIFHTFATFLVLLGYFESLIYNKEVLLRIYTTLVSTHTHTPTPTPTPTPTYMYILKYGMKETWKWSILLVLVRLFLVKCFMCCWNSIFNEISMFLSACFCQNTLCLVEALFLLAGSSNR